MQEYFSNICKNLILPKDKLLFAEAVGMDLDELIFYINQESDEYIREFLSNKKHIENHLLKKGSHVLRILLSHRAHQFRVNTGKYSEDEEVEEFIKNGFITINDFLPENDFTKVREIISREMQAVTTQGSSRYTSQANTVVKFSHSFLNKTIEQLFPINSRFQKLSGVAKSLNSIQTSLNIRQVNIVKEGLDTQHNYHTDVCYPLIKSFFYIHDTNKSQGPFCYCPASSNVDNPAILNWHYRNSLKISEKGVNFDISESEVRNMSLEMLTLEAKENTLFIANTFGFHRRFPGKPNEQRVTLNNEFLREYSWHRL